jgi:hypothetical protein
MTNHPNFDRTQAVLRYDTKLWMRDLKEGAAYLPK